MAKTKLHDIEICIEDDVLKVIPYKLQLNADGYFSADTSDAGQGEVLEFSMTHPSCRQAIGYILDSENWHETRTYWDGFSEWNTTEYLTVGETPAKIRKWLNKLPEYELSIGGQ